MYLCRSFLFLLLMVSFPVVADWTLVPANSSLGFVSIKKGSVAEIHHFNHLSGNIDSQRRFRLDVDLNSVATNIPVRDERMRKVLFETDHYPLASVVGILPDASYEHHQPGSAADAVVNAELTLHGQSQMIEARLIVVGIGTDRILVVTRDPVIVDTAAFGLAQGVERLRQIAKLPSIAKGVPVTFALVFKRTP